jgi:glyoxylase-like metal-dependent hydrolase (beta-lactamase superfamily II)
VSSGRIEVTGHLQHQSWRRRVLPPVEQVRPGLWSVPVPIPDSPLRYVSVYVYELEDGLALIDTGWPTDEAWTALSDGLVSIGAAVTDVRSVLITHAHHDHHGLAGRVRETSGAWVGMHPAEAETVARGEQDDQPWLNQMAAWARRRGAGPEEIAEILSPSRRSQPLPPLVPPDVLIDDGSFPLGASRGLQAVWTPGHTPGHLCFHDRDNDLMLSGDHVLPRITPNISYHARAIGDPLRDYLASLALIGKVSVDEVLPAHEYRFRHLDARTTALIEHHEHRLRSVRKAVLDHPGATTWEVSERLSWSRSWAETTGSLRWSAVGETLAHLVYLRNDGVLTNTGADVDTWYAVPEHR